MENYKNILTKRRNSTALMILVFLALGFYTRTFLLNIDAYIIGFISGILTSGIVMSVISVIRYSRIIKDDTKLKMEYNRENDERMKAIRSKAGMPMIMYTSIGMIIAGILLSYYDPFIFKVLSMAAAVQLTAAVIAKAYYTRTM